MVEKGNKKSIKSKIDIEKKKMFTFHFFMWQILQLENAIESQSFKIYKAKVLNCKSEPFLLELQLLNRRNRN